jgi:hypothetical protein
MQAWKLYDQVPMQAKSKLPDEGFEPRYLELTEGLWFPVSCKPKPALGVRWGHRVMVKCGCGRDIPFGRMTQHYSEAECGAGVGRYWDEAGQTYRTQNEFDEMALSWEETLGRR